MLQFCSIFVSGSESDLFAHMVRPNIVLDTLVWRLQWRKGRDSVSNRDKRIEYVAQVAKPLLEACPSLQQMLYTEPDNMIDNVSGRQFALSNSGELDIQPREEADLPSWKEI